MNDRVKRLRGGPFDILGGVGCSYPFFSEKILDLKIKKKNPGPENEEQYSGPEN